MQRLVYGVVDALGVYLCSILYTYIILSTGTRDTGCGTVVLDNYLLH